MRGFKFGELLNSNQKGLSYSQYTHIKCSVFLSSPQYSSNILALNFNLPNPTPSHQTANRCPSHTTPSPIVYLTLASQPKLAICEDLVVSWVSLSQNWWWASFVIKKMFFRGALRSKWLEFRSSLYVMHLLLASVEKWINWYRMT